MKHLYIFCLTGVLIFLASCEPDIESESVSDFDALSLRSDGSASSESSGSSMPSGISQIGEEDESGLITAGEWNDLNNWEFWNDLMNRKESADKLDYWHFYNQNRISILLTNNNQLVTNAKIELIKKGEVVWEAKTDNHGKAELWIDLFQDDHLSKATWRLQNDRSIDIDDYSISVNGKKLNHELSFYDQGVNQIDLNVYEKSSNRVELAFIVDATGSMGDEIEFLKDDLADVIQKVEKNNSSLEIFTSSVFYRDQTDDYVTRESNFTNNLNTTLKFIDNQNAGGGGDYPEAVHTALNLGIQELDWSENAKTRIAFLLLDAPPHHDLQVISDLQKSIKVAAKQGIKVIPITASGIDKETELLMRFFSISTNGTYVFITNDSGIGNHHIEPSIGDYDVEFLNELMVRLIKKYTD